jgi:hypothetical protein
MTDATLRRLLAVVAAVNLGLGLWIAVAPRSFYDAIGNFGAFNAHDLRDIST